MKKILVLLALLFNLSFAQLSFDRTRVIFDHSISRSQSIVVSNTSKSAPYLAQSWIENEQGQKLTGPLTALPILQRVNPGEEQQIRIDFNGASALPKDRESLLYLQVRGVPPKGGDNKVSITIQSRLKIFYRPQGLTKYDDKKLYEELKVTKNGNSLTLENPTPYHMVIYGFKSQRSSKLIDKDIILKPFSTQNVSVKVGNTPLIYFINDQGGTNSVYYQCSSVCSGQLSR